MKPATRPALTVPDEPSSSNASAQEARRSRASSIMPGMVNAPPSRERPAWYKALDDQAKFMQPIIEADVAANKYLPLTEQQQAQLQFHLLAASRAIDAKVHADDLLPPTVANQAYVETSRGAEWLLGSWKKTMVQSGQAHEEDEHWLKAGVLAALCYQRLPQVRPLFERLSGLNYVKKMNDPTGFRAWVSHCPNAEPRMTVVGDLVVDFIEDGTCVIPSTIVHESAHEAQLGDSVDFSSRPEWASKEPVALKADSSSRSHPRSGFIDIAQTLPFWGAASQARELPSDFLKYLSAPMELQAFLEQDAAEAWRHTCRMEQSSVDIRIKPEQLAKVGEKILACLKNLDLAPRSPPVAASASDVPVCFQFLWHDERLSNKSEGSPHGAQIKQLDKALQALGSILRVTASTGWDYERHAMRFDEVVQTIVSRDEQTPITLDWIADALRGFNAELLEEGVCMNGGRIWCAPQTSPSLTWPEAKAAPLRRLAANLIDAGHISTPEGLQKDMVQLMQKADFVDQVKQFQTQAAAGQIPAEVELQGAIHRLAAQLLGVSPSSLPPPALHVFEASPMLDFVKGFTVTPHQKRKAHWSLMPWQLNVPAHLLRDPERVAARLAKWAFDIACDAYYHARFSRFFVNTGVFDDLKEMNGSIRLPYPFMEHAFGGFRGSSNENEELVKRFKPTAYRRLWPADAQAIAWHTSQRGTVKAQMNDPTQTSQVRADAQEVYQRSSYRRFARPYAAVRRALGEAARLAACDSARLS